MLPSETLHVTLGMKATRLLRWCLYIPVGIYENSYTKLVYNTLIVDIIYTSPWKYTTKYCSYTKCIQCVLKDYILCEYTANFSRNASGVL